MSLVEKGHVKPISPMKVFRFEDIVEALRYLRAGTHLGKIVISNGPIDAKVEVPVCMIYLLNRRSTDLNRYDLHLVSCVLRITVLT